MVKDLALLLLWLGFSPWLGNFHLPWAWPEKEKREGRKMFREFPSWLSG